MGFHITNGMGDSIDDPSREQMREVLEALDPADEEHGAAWVEQDGYSLEWNVDGRLVLSTPQQKTRHLAGGATHAQAIDLWCALARRDFAHVLAQRWKPGNGFVLTPEREAEYARLQLEGDRRFYLLLGPERGDTPCRREQCARGAITHSVFCRVHHFETERRRACPFDD